MIRVTFEYSPPIDYPPPQAVYGESPPPPAAAPRPAEGVEDWLPLVLELGKAFIELLRNRRNR